MPIDDEVFLDSFPTPFDIGNLKEGDILKTSEFDAITDKAIPTRVDWMRKFIAELRDRYYSGKPPTQEEFIKLFKDHEKKALDEVGDLIERALTDEDDLMKITKIKKSGTRMTFELEKIDKAEQINLVKSIVKKLINKLTKEQLSDMLEQGIQHNTDVNKLKKIDNALDSKEVKVEGKRGCFKFVVDGEDLLVLS